MNEASSSSAISCRAEMTFTRIGRLTPVTTWMRASQASAMLTLVAVSPYMSVSMMVPSPSSTEVAAAAILAFNVASVSSAAAHTATMPGTG
jgi:hypothetical protein